MTTVCETLFGVDSRFWDVFSGGRAPALHFPSLPLWIPASAGVTKWGRGNYEVGRPAQLHRHHRLHVAGGEGVHVGEDQVAGAVPAELGFVLPADYGEGAQHVAGVVAVQAVEVEVEGVQPGPQVPAAPHRPR